MVRRFEFPRAVMNEIKKLDVPDQLEALDEYFNKIGMTQKLIDDMGGTTLGIWAQVQEKFQVIMRDMGKPALSVVSNFLTDILGKLENGELDRFANVGARWIESILTGLTNGITSIYEWFASISSNSEFQKQTTLFGKVKWIINDVYANFIEWLDGGGRDKIAKVASDLLQILTASIEASMEMITPIAVKIGSAIGSGIIDGFNQAINDSWLLQAISNPKGLASSLAAKVVGKKVWEHSQKDNERQPKSHSSGLSNVPYNGYPAILHKGERVMTAEENRDYSRGGGGGGGVTVNVYGMTVREDADIDKVGDALFRKIYQARMAGA